MKAIIVAAGAMSRPATTIALDDDGGKTLVIAADGGAAKAQLLGLHVDVVVGDGDSLGPQAVREIKDAGIEVHFRDPHKDESDAELAVREALARGATSLKIVAALGGARFEHSLANVLLLTLPDLAGRDAAIVDGPSTVRVIGTAGPAQLEIAGEPGDYVSLLPLTERVDGVTTDGMAYPLSDDRLFQGSTRGLSNELTSRSGHVAVRSGRLAVIHTRVAELSSDD